MASRRKMHNYESLNMKIVLNKKFWEATSSVESAFAIRSGIHVISGLRPSWVGYAANAGTDVKSFS